MKGWIIGTALIITPYFGFETVPQMVEEGTFPIKSMYKAILGSVITCGLLYVLFFFALAGMGSWETLTEGGENPPFVAIKVIERLFGWQWYALFFGVVGVLFTIGTCLLGFWYSSVRLLYAMGRQNFLPRIFAKTNRFGQPIVPNLLILGVSLLFFAIQSKLTYIENYFTMMAFACACAYAVTMIAAMNLARKHPEWERPFRLRGGQIFRAFALIIALVIAVLCILGQGAEAWQGIGAYLAIGAVLWIWMIVAKWPKEKVWMQTPEGNKEF
jgi:APA family basic amino acid/polyamine antiporter